MRHFTLWYPLKNILFRVFHSHLSLFVVVVR